MQLLKAGADFAGRYEVIRAISTGGMGVVYEVLHRDTQRRRALKLMLPSMLADDDMRARFKREAIVTAGIESEHLVEVFDAGVEEESGAPFIVMELLRGEDLGARLKRGERTRPSEVLQIVDQVARGLSRTHAAGIIHRDLKPENLFVTHRDDGTLRMKVLDFGIAKLIDRSSKNSRSMGTPLYMAPEQMTGQSVGPAADVYAVGQIAFTLLVGSPYFHAEAEQSENILGLMMKVGAGTTQSAFERGEALGVVLPRAFAGWFARATNLDPKQRFESVRELASALHDALRGAQEELPVSSGAARRAAALQATLAAPTGETSSEAIPPTVGSAPLEDAMIDRSGAAPARTHVSTGDAPHVANAAIGETASGPHSRTVGNELAKPDRGRSSSVVGWLVGGGAIALVAVVAWTQLAGGTVGPSAADTPAPPPTELPRQDPTTPDPGPQVAPSGNEEPSVASASPSASSPTLATASAAPSASAPRPFARPAGGPLPRPPATGAASPPPSAPPPAPASTVWGGPRR